MVGLVRAPLLEVYAKKYTSSPSGQALDRHLLLMNMCVQRCPSRIGTGSSQHTYRWQCQPCILMPTLTCARSPATEGFDECHSSCGRWFTQRSYMCSARSQFLSLKPSSDVNADAEKHAKVKLSPATHCYCSRSIETQCSARPRLGACKRALSYTLHRKRVCYTARGLAIAYNWSLAAEAGRAYERGIFHTLHKRGISHAKGVSYAP